MFKMTRWINVSMLTIALCLSLVACEDPKITPEQATPFVATWAQKVGSELKEQSASSATSEALSALLLARVEQERKALSKSLPPFNALAEQVYAKRKFKAAFIKKGKLSEAGQAILAQLERVEEDGFNAKLYQAKEAKEKLEELKSLREQYQALGDFTPGESERAYLVSYLTAKKAVEYELKPEQLEGLTQELLKAPAGEPLRQQIAKYGELSKKMAHAEAEIEVILSTGFLRYAQAMRYHRLPEVFVHERHDDRYNDSETRGRRPLEAQATYEGGSTWRTATFVAKEMAKNQTVPLLRAALVSALESAMTDDASAKQLANLVPSPQYAALRKEHARYKKLAADGDWEALSEQKSLKAGAKSAAVKALKLRLKKEGYLSAKAVVDERFDADLTDAIKAYQRTHQMDDDGKPGRTFWRSLNVSAKERAEQIMLNMKRWRESDVQHHDHPLYVLINIPDFNVEIWKQQKREMRMRIVVGNNDQDEDEETKKKIHPNRTPTLSAYIDRVIYNPFWNVTPRIRGDEILVDVRKDLEPRYVAKLGKILGVSATPAAAVKPGPVGPSSPNGVVLGAQDNTPKPSAGAERFTRKSKEGLVFDVEAIRAAYYEKHQSDIDLKSQLPYLNPETGIIDVSTTDPNNIPPWYAANGYEVMFPGKSWEFVRQLNGKENALGQVKVIFPNLHDVYLHDTTAKALFNKTLRAYSHGCMRMHKPLDFAEWLLRNDGTWEEYNVKKILSDISYEPIFLKTKVPVHIVYHTVYADDEGKANFLLDVYGYDKEGKIKP